MDFSADWKAFWPVSSVFSPPLLISNENPKTPIGPLLFAPNSKIPAIPFLHCESLSPRLPPYYPNLSLPRFLQSYDSIPSLATSISSLLGSQLPDYASHFHSFNSLQLLRIPNRDLIIAFFPTGENSDRVGFCLLTVEDGTPSVHSQRDNFFQTAKEGCTNHQRIRRLLVNPFDEFSGDDGFGDASYVSNCNKNIVIVGFLIVSTDYSVYWYRIGISNLCRKNDISVSLDYVGCANSKMLKGSSVVSTCWSPHLGEECLVMLKSGDVMLYDVNSSCERNERFMSVGSGTNRAVRKRMQVSLNDEASLLEEDGGEGGWFGCEFSWHPRIFIVSHSNRVFIVDSRLSGKCQVSCLLKLEKFSMVKNDVFMALSRAGSDGFYFTIATRQLLLLCDVRKPLMPVLRWAHGIKNPCYMDVFRLSNFRANAEDKKYHWASESGYCVLLGSFWDSEFSLFCYGPSCKDNKSVSSEIFKFCNSYFAWGLPSEFLLSNRDCNCGSCIVRHEFLKTSLPVWIDWRQKKDLVLGFGILDADISMQMSTPGASGGFVLIRMTSSGKLEAQQYLAAWELEKTSEVGHKRKSTFSEDKCMYNNHDSEYGEKKFQHLKLDYLNSYLNDNLAKYMASKIEKATQSGKDSRKMYPQLKSKSVFHEEICHKLKDFGFPKAKPSFTVSDMLKDISLPTSIHEVALRSMWAALPTNFLQLGFSMYSDFHQELESTTEPLEFLFIPKEPQLPPFPLRKPSCRSNKWSSKVQPYDTLIGPILPPHFLTTLHNLYMEELKNEKVLHREETEEFSISFQLKQQCDNVMGVVEEHVLNCDTKTHDDDYVSLADDTDNNNYQSPNFKFSYHKPLAFSENASTKKSRYEHKIFSTHVFRRNQGLASDLIAEMTGQEIFDVGCPIELKFDKEPDKCFGAKELEAFRVLKELELDFQKSFKPYQDYVSARNKLE